MCSNLYIYQQLLARRIPKPIMSKVIVFELKPFIDILFHTSYYLDDDCRLVSASLAMFLCSEIGLFYILSTPQVRADPTHRPVLYQLQKVKNNRIFRCFFLFGIYGSKAKVCDIFIIYEFFVIYFVKMFENIIHIVLLYNKVFHLYRDFGYRLPFLHVLEFNNCKKPVNGNTKTVKGICLSSIMKSEDIWLIAKLYLCLQNKLIIKHNYIIIQNKLIIKHNYIIIQNQLIIKHNYMIIQNKLINKLIFLIF